MEGQKSILSSPQDVRRSQGHKFYISPIGHRCVSYLFHKPPGFQYLGMFALNQDKAKGEYDKDTYSFCAVVADEQFKKIIYKQLIIVHFKTDQQYT